MLHGHRHALFDDMRKANMRGANGFALLVSHHQSNVQDHFGWMASDASDCKAVPACDSPHGEGSYHAEVYIMCPSPSSCWLLSTSPTISVTPSSNIQYPTP